jgi:molybdopterin synthase catalytic subunit
MTLHQPENQTSLQYQRFVKRKKSTDCQEFEMIRLTNQEIDYQQLTESVRANSAGAVVLFLGTVREMTGELQTLALDYDAYPEMALAKMEEIAAEARETWPVIEVAIEHRLGHLELGAISIAAAVSSPHRTDAFAAGRFLIDELKVRVPIWKKENWADGTTQWVHPDGKPVDAQVISSKQVGQ